MKINKISERINKITNFFIILLMGLLVTLVFTQVILRFVFSSSLIWSEELSRYIFVWLMFLGISLSIYKNRHIKIMFFVNLLSKKLNKIVKIISILITGTFFVFTTYLGIQYSADSFAAISYLLPIKLGYIYSIIPLSSIISIIFCIGILVKKCKKEDR